MTLRVVKTAKNCKCYLAAAINTWPGPANLKAMGGTFLPSFQEAQRQDRYGWVEVGTVSSYDATNGVVQNSAVMPDTLPVVGWIRTSNGTASSYGYYSLQKQFNTLS